MHYILCHRLLLFICFGEQPDLLPWQNLKKRAADTDSPSKRFAADRNLLNSPHLHDMWNLHDTPATLLQYY